MTSRADLVAAGLVAAALVPAAAQAQAPVESPAPAPTPAAVPGADAADPAPDPSLPSSLSTPSGEADPTATVPVPPPPAEDKPKQKAKKRHKAKKRPDDEDAATEEPAEPAVAAPHPPATPDFALPPTLVPIFQAAAAEYGVPWEILAAINAVETGFGANLGPSSAGAVGWMQFMPETWATYGLDADLDGRDDPADPADAIFAAASYLRAAGAEDDLRGAILAYNHAGWYADLVLAKARALQKLPVRAVAALGGLAAGRYPVPGSRVHQAGAGPRIRISGPIGRPVVAPVAGHVVFTGHSSKGSWIVLEDAYGNRFTYGHVGRLARRYARLRSRPQDAASVARDLRLPVDVPSPEVVRHTWPTSKERLFAAPHRPHARSHGGQAQLDGEPGSALAGAARRLDVPQAHLVAARLRPGAEVPAGATLGLLGGPVADRGRAHVTLTVVPPGRGAHPVSPGPLVDGWRKRPTPDAGRRLTLGTALLLDGERLADIVVSDRRIRLTRCGRDELRAGRVDRRVSAGLEALAGAGLHPAVAALRCGPGRPSAARAAGLGFEAAAINGAPLRAGSRTAGRALRVLGELPEGLRPAHATVAGRRLVVRYTLRAPKGAAVARALNAALAPVAWVAGPQSGAAPQLDGAPVEVKAVAAAADGIVGAPYSWGGGHATWLADGYDCSGAVSFALHAGGLLDSPLTSGDFASWGDPGPGSWITIYANPGHVIMRVGTQFYGTSGFGHPDAGTGPAWFAVAPSAEYLAGFSVRHPPGY